MTAITYRLDISRNIEKSIPTFHNVGKYLENFTYRKKVNRETQLAFVSFEKLNRSNLINSVSLTKRITENSLGKESISNVFKSKSRYIEVTNKSYIKNGYSVPMFYGMEIEGEYLGYESSIKNINIIYDRETKTIWSDTKSEWDPVNEVFRSITVKVSTDTGIKNLLFNSQPLFKEATLEDINPETLSFYEDRFLYSVDYDSLSGDYTYTVLNGEGPWFYKEVIGEGIHLTSGNLEDIQEPWFPSYSIGETIRTVESINYYYSAGNMDSISYSPRFPYQTQKEEAKVIGPNLIKLDKHNLVIDEKKRLNLELIIFDNQGSMKFALTTDQRKNGQLYNRNENIRWESVSYNCDSSNSIVEISWSSRLLSTDYIEATYVHTSYSQEVKSLNLNPRYNSRILNHIYVTFLKPGRNQKVEWLELILDSNEGYTITRCPEDIEVRPGDSINIDFSTGQFLDERLKTYLLLDLFQISNPMDERDVYKKDIRLKNGLDLGKEIEILRKYPHLWQFNEFSTKPIEYSDKYFSIVSIDTEEVLADKSQHKNILEKVMTIGSGFYVEYPDEKVDVCRIQRYDDDIVEVISFERTPGSDFSLGVITPGSSINLEEDIVIPVDSTEENTEGPGVIYRFDLSSVIPKSVGVYLIVSENGKILTSNIFYIRIRE